MGRRMPLQAEQWSQVAPDRLVIRINWPRVVFVGLVATLLAAIVTTLVTLRYQATSDHTAQAVLGGPPPANHASPAPQADPPAGHLVAGPVAGGTDESLPLGILVRGPSEIASGAAIEIIGLPSGWALSAGRPFGEKGWRIPAAKLPGAAILPPRGFSGAIDLVAELRLADDTLVERQSVRRVRIDPGLATTPPQPVESMRATAIKLPSTSVSSDEKVVSEEFTGNGREADSEEITSLLKVGEGLLAARDLAAARIVLRRAVEAGNARAALLLGETYDGGFLRRFGYNPDVDRTTARTWYEVARRLGSTEALQRLNRLAHDGPGGDLPSRP